MNKPKLYLSFDIEADGTNVMCNNMLSIGIYGVDKSESEIFTFYANIEELDGHIQERKCMEEFWSHHPLAWENTQKNKQSVFEVMKYLSNSFIELSKNYRIEFIAMPACFDWMFFKSYYEFAKQIDNTITYDIGYSCTCFSTMIKTYKTQNKMSNREINNLLKTFVNINPYKEHNAIYDAKVQAIQFIKLLNIIER